MKILFVSLLVLISTDLFSQPASASMQWGFADVSLNRLFWTRDTQNKSLKRSFNFFEIEGGGQFNWGELYGFLDIENIGRDAGYVRTAAKAVGRYYLFNTNLSIYAHVYDFNELGFGEQNRVIGLGYQWAASEWWIKPFLGVHDVTQSYFSGLNGFMGGVSLGYSFKLFQQSFLATNWHETEFARKEDYAFGNGGKKVGQNGAFGFWWTPHHCVTLGAQWRYAIDKLGTAGLSSATIATLKYNL